MRARIARSFGPTKNRWVAMAFSRVAAFSAEECDAIIGLAEAEKSGWARTLRRAASASYPGLLRYSGLLVEGAGDRKLARLFHKLKELVASLNAQIWRYDISGRREDVSIVTIQRQIELGGFTDPRAHDATSPWGACPSIGDRLRCRSAAVQRQRRSRILRY